MRKMLSGEKFFFVSFHFCIGSECSSRAKNIEIASHRQCQTKKNIKSWNWHLTLSTFCAVMQLAVILLHTKWEFQKNRKLFSNCSRLSLRATCFFFSPLSAFFKWHRLLPRDMFTKLAITIISIACWRLNRSRKSSSLSICDAQNTQMKWKNIAWNTFR